jgi:glycosyltransferase involved in cell wall biosynthesis
LAHEVSGLLFLSEDADSLAAAIEKALTDVRLLRLLRKGARKRYEAMFSLSHMLEGYRRLYTENS